MNMHMDYTAKRLNSCSSSVKVKCHFKVFAGFTCKDFYFVPSFEPQISPEKIFVQW